MISNVVFDFDGTIADSRAALLGLYNRLAEKHGFKPMRVEDLEVLRKLSILERCRRLGVPVYRLPSLVMEVKRSYVDVLGDVAPYEGMIPLLAELHRRGLTVGIISSNAQENIRRFLARHGAEALVHCIYCSSNIFGKDRMISRYLKTFRLTPGQVLYVGDEHRDVLACKKTKLRVQAVTWGVDSLELLQEAEPDFFAHQPPDILRQVARLNGWPEDGGTGAPT